MSYYYYPNNSLIPFLLHTTTPSTVAANSVTHQIQQVIPFPIKSTEVFIVIQLNSPADPTSSLPQLTTFFISTLFSVVPPCFSTPTASTDETNLATWPTTCGDGKCSRSGECVCKDSFSGIDCSTLPCSQCQPSNSDPDQCKVSPPDTFNDSPNAIPFGSCGCVAGWTGDSCTIPTDCTEASKTICKNGGQLVDPNSPASPTTPAASPTCDVTKPCSCPNFWTDAKCSTCPSNITCINGGTMSSSKCLCNCSAGFLSNRCECRGVQILFTIPGCNSLLEKFPATSAPPADEKTQEDLYILQTSILQVVAEFLQTDIQSFSKFTILSTCATRGDMNESSSTKVSFTLSFGCDRYNKSTTLQGLTTLVSNKLSPPTLTNHQTIKDIFNPDDATVQDPTITPTDPINYGGDGGDGGDDDSTDPNEDPNQSIETTLHFVITIVILSLAIFFF